MTGINFAPSYYILEVNPVFLIKPKFLWRYKLSITVTFRIDKEEQDDEQPLSQD